MSKIILSHDVDHISPSEHLRDLIIPKFVTRAIVECMRGMISREELRLRLAETWSGRWNFIAELAEFDRSKKIDATFFFATGNGLGLQYSAETAKPAMARVLTVGHQVGLHGLARQSLGEMLAERARFKAIYERDCAGMRLHYLFPDTSVLSRIHACGYVYDSSLRGDGDAKLHGDGLVHFPVHLMDCDFFQQRSRFQCVSNAQAFSAAKERLEKLIDNNVNYISVLFHDRYFSAAHAGWRDWYMGLIDWMYAQGIRTCSYEHAVNVLKPDGCSDSGSPAPLHTSAG